jgi:hypothetical protein
MHFRGSYASSVSRISPKFLFGWIERSSFVWDGTIVALRIPYDDNKNFNYLKYIS